MKQFDASKMSQVTSDWEMHPSMECQFYPQYEVPEEDLSEMYKFSLLRNKKRCEADAEYFANVIALLYPIAPTKHK